MATTPSTPPMEAPKPKSRRTMYAVIGAVVVIVIVVVALYLGGYILGSTSGTPVNINDDGTCAANATTCNYSPATVTIAHGGKVTWTDKGTYAGGHTVTNAANSSQTFSVTFAPNDVKSVTFPNAGTFSYYCTIHAWMTGTVIVT